ncbi:hypothetical protein SCA6_009940 [Theobroma cacao]
MVGRVCFLTMKRLSSSSKRVVNNVVRGEIEWELRPGGMLVQKRNVGDVSSGPMIKIKVSHGSYHHDITVPAQSTFGKPFFPVQLSFVFMPSAVAICWKIGCLGFCFGNVVGLGFIALVGLSLATGLSNGLAALHTLLYDMKIDAKLLSLVQIEGDLKRVLAQETGLEPKEQRLLFQGKEKDDEECLHMVGVKDMSKVVLLEDPASKERKLDEMKRNQSILKAYEEVAKVRAEVDKLSEKVIALEAIVRGGTKVSEKKFLVLTELLMVQLLQLDTIEANGEAKVQRKVEVRHVQGLVDTLDNLKARNSNPFSSSCNAVSVTTKWEAFESGVGSLTAPAPLPSSTRITQDWEVFD